MVQRIKDEEAQRWKRKFLDALEEHEIREKSLIARIKLLRRGLLGVSLAGDGHDQRLDKQLADLRASLRGDDREAGLERVLEQIEQSVIRLDTEKTTSNWALQQAFESAINELCSLPLSVSTRRQINKFSSGLEIRLQDPQQHVGLIKQFIDLLRASIQALLEVEKQKEGTTGSPVKGFWQRLFSTSADSAPSSSTLPANNHASAVNPLPETRFPEQPEKSAIPDEVITADVERNKSKQDKLLNESMSAGQNQGQHWDEDLDLQPEEGSGFSSQQDEPEVIEGELIRDRSGLAEPAFSYIAGHVEPLLLRILESIHITGESVNLVESIRRSVIKGLNWYDFVAILEQILLVLRNATDGQRAEFQGFLSGVTEGLAQVQAFVEQSKRNTDKNSAAEAELDTTVRAQIQGIRTAVESSDNDIEALKSSVQSQIESIISSLDGFKAQRADEDHALSAEMRALTERIASLEHESSELRLNLARQQENSTKDKLTELPNREAYDLRLRQLMDEWLHGASFQRRDDDRALCLAVADVDFFKNINDSYGHLAGDKVLKIIAREMVSRLREKDFIGRYGGKVFVIIMPDTRPADAEHVLNKLRLAIAAIPFHFKERQIEITISFGVIEAVREDSPETIFDRADQALFRAKENGRNRVQRDR
jgi:diguanylate cyclase